MDHLKESIIKYLKDQKTLMLTIRATCQDYIGGNCRTHYFDSKDPAVKFVQSFLSFLAKRNPYGGIDTEKILHRFKRCSYCSFSMYRNSSRYLYSIDLSPLGVNPEPVENNFHLTSPVW